jgi:hypothetical protein
VPVELSQLGSTVLRDVLRDVPSSSTAALPLARSASFDLANVYETSTPSLREHCPVQVLAHGHMHMQSAVLLALLDDTHDGDLVSGGEQSPPESLDVLPHAFEIIRQIIWPVGQREKPV